MSLSSSLFCFLLFFDYLELLDFIVFHLSLSTFLFHLPLYFRIHLFRTFNRLNIWTLSYHFWLSNSTTLRASLSSHVLFGFLSQSTWSLMIYEIIFTRVMSKLMWIYNWLTCHSILHFRWATHILLGLSVLVMRL